MAHESHTKTLPADLRAPPVVNTWRTRALIVGVVFSVIAAGLAFADGSIDHVLRAWLLGLVLTFGFAVGGLALLMVQYVTGGKWGLLLRRPLEAMSRTLPLVFVYWIPIAIFQGKLYMWANHGIVDKALSLGQITKEQVEPIDHAIKWKAPMFTPTSFIVVSLICFANWGFYSWRLNSLALKRDADSPDNTPFWIKKFENLSGFGVLVYSLTMTAVVIYWVMSLDVTW